MPFLEPTEVRTFVPCPTCGLLVCVRVWHHGDKDTPPAWRESKALNPVTGTRHVCEETP